MVGLCLHRLSAPHTILAIQQTWIWSMVSTTFSTNNSNGNEPFACEADMMPAIQRIASGLWPGARDVWLLLNEHSVYSHVPDLVAARLDVETLRDRIEGRWIRGLNQREIDAMRALRPDRGSRLETVARRMRVAVDHARIVLRGLLRDGYIERTEAGSYARLAPIRPILSHVVSFEAKRMDARGALLQARAHTMFVDAAYVVCDHYYRHRFDALIDAYARERVGLIALDSGGRDFELMLRASRASLRDVVLRTLGTERALARLFDPSTRETNERRLPTSSEVAGLRTAPVLVGDGAEVVRELLASAAPDAARQLVVS